MFVSEQERRLIALRDALSGQVLPGSDGRRYPLRDRIGEGSQGWVFRATWNGSIDVVVKVLRPDVASKDSLARFQREAQVLRMLSQQPTPNPHIVRFFDHAYASVQVAATGDTWTLPFTVLELVEGVTLERAIAQSQPAGLGLERARRILRHVVLALKDVHAQNVVHRDLKPSNILIDNSTGREVAKVTDFGLAKLIDAGMHKTTALAGATVGYAPPEQFEHGNKRVGRHTDVFSLATIFYELVCGSPAFPFREDDHPLLVVRRILEEKRPAFARVPHKLPRELAERPDVVAAVDAVLHRALSPDPVERPASMTEMHDAFEQALSLLSAAPSLPLSRQGEVVVRSAPRPVTREIEVAGAPTLLADERGGLSSTPPPGSKLPPMRISNPNVGPPPPSQAMVWRAITGAMSEGAFRAIAVSPGGDLAIAAGPMGVARWDAQGWTRLALPSAVDPRLMRAATWLGSSALFAGASPMAVAVSADGAQAAWRFEGNLVFNGAATDGAGIVLAGERDTDRGPVGVIAEIAPAPGGTLAPRAIEVTESGPLRAALRLDGVILACGDGGALVAVRGREAPRVVRPCAPPLQALVALGDGTAIVVGGGGFVYRVWPTLDTQLEAIQTTKDLFALAIGSDGTAWCGGADRRVLRRTSTGWTRVGANAGIEGANVIALHAAGSRVLAFCGDGSVLEGFSR